jgi:hypothetical protein
MKILNHIDQVIFISQNYKPKVWLDITTVFFCIEYHWMEAFIYKQNSYSHVETSCCFLHPAWSTSMMHSITTIFPCCATVHHVGSLWLHLGKTPTNHRLWKYSPSITGSKSSTRASIMYEAWGTQRYGRTVVKILLKVKQHSITAFTWQPPVY